MELKNEINNIINEKLSDGTIEKIVGEKFEKCINESVNELFRSYGDIGKTIKNKVSEILIPAIERCDFSNHIVKLDTILSEIINSTALVENKTLMENFKELMIEDEKMKTINVSELFEKWCGYVSKNIETYGLDVNFDDTPSYESVEVTMDVECDEGHAWSDFERASIIFECHHDERMNVLIPISRWKKHNCENWSIEIKTDSNLNTLRYLSEFDVFLLRLNRMFCEIKIDIEFKDDYIYPEAEPEASFS